MRCVFLCHTRAHIRRYVRLCYELMCDASTSRDKQLDYCGELMAHARQLTEKYAVNLFPMAVLT